MPWFQFCCCEDLLPQCKTFHLQLPANNAKQNSYSFIKIHNLLTIRTFAMDILNNPEVIYKIETVSCWGHIIWCKYDMRASAGAKRQFKMRLYNDLVSFF